MAAKKTGELIPLCHPLPLSHCEVNFEFPKSADRIVITASARITAQTGVEMEALMAVSVAALTIYDMCKAVDKKMRIGNIKLLRKEKRPAYTTVGPGSQIIWRNFYWDGFVAAATLNK